MEISFSVIQAGQQPLQMKQEEAEGGSLWLQWSHQLGFTTNFSTSGAKKGEDLYEKNKQTNTRITDPLTIPNGGFRRGALLGEPISGKVRSKAQICRYLSHVMSLLTCISSLLDPHQMVIELSDFPSVPQ